MSNLNDLNNHLFDALAQLSNKELSGDELTETIERSKAVQGVANTILNNAKLVLDAKKLQVEFGLQQMPGILTDKS